MCKRRKRTFRVSRSLASFRVFVFSCFRVLVRCDMRLGSTESVYKKVLQTERAADRDCFTAFVQRQHLYGCTRSCDCGQTVDSQ